MNAAGTDTVASSWIDALGGLSICWILRIPPDFWADAGPANTTAAMAASKAKRPLWVFIVSSRTLLDSRSTSWSYARTLTRFTVTVIKNSRRVQPLGCGKLHADR